MMWRLSRIVGQPDVFQVIDQVPHRVGAGILCKALTRAGVPRTAVQRVHASLLAFDDLVQQHAGDRDTFEQLAAGFARRGSPPPSIEKGRKLAFRGNSAVWGVQAALQLVTAILRPDPGDPAKLEVAYLFGLTDLRRLRHDVRWTIWRTGACAIVGSGEDAVAAEPLGHDGSGDGEGLVRPFCSGPLPEPCVAGPSGELRHVTPEGAVGRTAAATAIFGYRHGGVVASPGQQAPPRCQVAASLLTPAEHLQFDLLVHEDLPWAMQPTVVIQGALDGGPAGVFPEGAGPPFRERIVDMGQGLAGIATPHLPGYPALLEWAFGRLGASPSPFRVFRFRMVHPPIPARVVLTCGFRPDPGDHQGVAR